MGIVTTAGKKVIGIVTIEDILETIVGELNNETDIIKDGVFKISATSYQVTPSANAIDVFNKYLNNKTPVGVTSKTTFNRWFQIQKTTGEVNKSNFIKYENLII
jgi:CBS domain containing-hemolysin-like protein